MLLKKIKLVNFRQFTGEQEIIFATDQNKNITILMGENGSGKTTLAQAFLWVLYGITEFNNKSLLNRPIEENMSINEQQIVKVELHLKHNDIDYVIVKEQNYRKDYSGIKYSNPELIVSYKKDGQQEFLGTYQIIPTIQNILPHELSRFFFFDGERIKKMSAEIERGKSQEFANAVRGLLGLTALINTLEHLKPTLKNSVVGRYNAKIDELGNQKISEYSKRIEVIQNEIEDIDSRLEEIEKQSEYYQNQSTILKEKIMSFAQAEKMQQLHNKMTKDIQVLNVTKKDAIKVLLNTFNKNTPAFLAKVLINASLKELTLADKIDKGIPDMQANTIDFLIKRGYCVCGTKLEAGKDAYNTIIEALDFLPPKSIGISINQFINESLTKTKMSESYYMTINNQFARVRDLQLQIDEKEKKISEIDRSLLNYQKIKAIKEKQIDADKRVKNFEKEKSQKLMRKGSIETEKRRLENERDQLILVDERNKQYDEYRQYALHLWKEIKDSYDIQEKITREELEKNINEIFSNIYESGISIKIDEKYNIKVYVDETANQNSDLDRSTAQNYSVIFSFIAGIIKMAKNKAKSDISEEVSLSDAESYPLVMDAPLSAFDKKRIKNICEVLPKIAQQVIIFIKDTDGEIAQRHMGDKIGLKYLLKMRGLTETTIIKGSENYV